MSLDVGLYKQEAPGKAVVSVLFTCEDGTTRTVKPEEWDIYFGFGSDPQNVFPEGKQVCLYSSNITHNLNRMADVAGIYKELWSPEELGITRAQQLIDPLQEGLERLKSNPEKYSKYNASNGWGLYPHLVKFVEEYLAACREYPDAVVDVSR